MREDSLIFGGECFIEGRIIINILDAATRNCHVDVVKAVIGAGADAKHRVDGVRLLHRIMKGGTAIC